MLSVRIVSMLSWRGPVDGAGAGGRWRRSRSWSRSMPGRGGMRMQDCRTRPGGPSSTSSPPMASRQEEKERRRAERLAAEAAENAAKRGRDGVAACARRRARRGRVVGVVIAWPAAVGTANASDGNGNPTSSRRAPRSLPREPRPRRRGQGGGLHPAEPADRGPTHVTTTVTYQTNPPTSGNHNPEPALDGIYGPATRRSRAFVHALEHGRIEIQYKPGTSARRIAQLETLANEPLFGKAAYKVLLFENTTKMPYAVAATAWGQMIRLQDLQRRRSSTRSATSASSTSTRAPRLHPARTN